MLGWDVANGVSRRCWAGNKNARETVERMMEREPECRVVVPAEMDEDALDKLEFEPE